MKKLVTLTLVFALMATAAMASGTRLRTMGNAHTIVKDPGNIWMFPSTINMYQDQAEAVIDYTNSPYYNDFGGFLSETLRRVGAHFTFNKNTNPFVLGIYIENEDFFINSVYFPYGLSDGGFSIGSKDFYFNSNRSFNVFFGKQLGTNPFGAHLRVNHISASDNSPATVSYTHLMLTLGMTTSGGTTDWALALWMQSWTDEDAGGPITEPDGNFGAKLSVRKFSGMWVWHGSLKYDKQGITRTITQVDSKYSCFAGKVGAGLNYSVTSNAMFVADLGIAYESAKDEDTDNNVTPAAVTEEKGTSLTIPYWKVGMDGRVFDWLDVRFGATNSNDRIKQEFTPSGTENKATANDVNAFLGAGFHFGSLVIDAWLDAAWLTYGPDFIGGNGDEDNDPLFGELTLTYMLGN